MGVTIDLEDLICLDCGNTGSFHWDTVTKEIICLDCGLVVEQIWWRENYYARV